MAKNGVARTNPVTASATISIGLIGNPNTGKTSLFNALTGLRHKVANYPGVTVEKKTGTFALGDGRKAEITDLPGLYSLNPKSSDEKIAVDALHGRLPSVEPLQAVVVVVDAGNLARNLFLVSQVLELNLPVVLALNMMDEIEKRGLTIDVGVLSERLGLPVVPIVARRRVGIDSLKDRLNEVLGQSRIPRYTAVEQAGKDLLDIMLPLREHLARQENFPSETAAMAAAIHQISTRFQPAPWEREEAGHPHFGPNEEILEKCRALLEGREVDWQGLETTLRYNWIDQILTGVIGEEEDAKLSPTEMADKLLTHRLAGPLIFLFVFGLIFQSIFSWAEMPMDFIEGGVAWTGEQAGSLIPPGMLHDLVVDGIIAGVGSVLVFLPQILLLFFFLALLEDSGYLARSAFMMDRLMRGIGLSGRAVIPLLSSFACAIPGIMATRTIPNWRERLVTIMIAPLMSCSARLPVYALMIAAFIPQVTFLGIFSLSGFVLLGMYLLGTLGAVTVAFIAQKLRNRRHPRPLSTFIMELPPYRRPSLRWAGVQVLDRARIFITQAGQIILAMSIVLWALAYFPRAEQNGEKAVPQLGQSYAGQIGKAIEPVIEPLGFDWKMGVALVTSFAAREVAVSTMATMYNVEEGEGETVSLRQ
ncbi:MAG TPA: ferrous iron transport protein B, partial [Calditrichia bacterium]|nr:ferrous iron transport protein B [Calditrichia bacterium]